MSASSFRRCFWLAGRRLRQSARLVAAGSSASLRHCSHHVGIVWAYRRLLCRGAAVAGALAVAASAGAGRPWKLVILDYPYGRQCPAAGYEDRGDRWHMNTCNCTSYVAWALQANDRRVDWFQLGRMDARNWPDVAREAGIREGRVPLVGAVAVWPSLSPPYGHVAFVTAVHRDKTFDVAEYNLLRRFRFDARYRLSPVGASFVYVPLQSSG